MQIFGAFPQIVRAGREGAVSPGPGPEGAGCYTIGNSVTDHSHVEHVFAKPEVTDWIVCPNSGHQPMALRSFHVTASRSELPNVQRQVFVLLPNRFQFVLNVAAAKFQSVSILDV